MQQRAASQSTIPTSLLSEIRQPYREFPVVRASATQDVEVANSKQVINESMAEDIGASPILSLINVPSNGVVLNDDVTLDISRNVVIRHPRSVMQVFVPPDHHMASRPLPEDQPNPSSKFGDVIEAKVGGMVVSILFDSGQPAQIDAFLAVKSAQIDPHYVATSTPSYGDYYMESHLQKQALLCVADWDLFGFKQPLTSDGRSIPPPNVVTCLASSCSILLDLMGSYHGDSEWSCATLRFGGYKGVRIFDPGVVDGVEFIQLKHEYQPPPSKSSGVLQYPISSASQDVGASSTSPRGADVAMSEKGVFPSLCSNGIRRRKGRNYECWHQWKDLRSAVLILTSTLRARWFSTMGELIGILRCLIHHQISSAISPQ